MPRRCSRRKHLVADAMMRSSRGSKSFLRQIPTGRFISTKSCAAIGVAERTLRASCEEYLGMGPIRFLTLRRMHLVRQALLSAVPPTSTVSRIATDHGFWELGRFAVAYRAAFGELPSETLKRPTKQIAIHPLLHARVCCLAPM